MGRSEIVFTILENHLDFVSEPVCLKPIFLPNWFELIDVHPLNFCDLYHFVVGRWQWGWNTGFTSDSISESVVSGTTLDGFCPIVAFTLSVFALFLTGMLLLLLLMWMLLLLGLMLLLIVFPVVVALIRAFFPLRFVVTGVCSYRLFWLGLLLSIGC